MNLEHPFNNWQYGRVDNEEAPIVEDGAITKDGIIDLLNEDDGKEEDKEEKPEKEEEDIEDKEGDGEEEVELDVEEEEKLPDEESLELVVPVKKADILKKYPGFDKEFPAVMALYYKAQQYTDILPTLADAREAVESKEILDTFKGDLSKGDTARIIHTIKKNAPDSYDAFVDNYLGTLAKVDKEAYFHVTHNVMAQALNFTLAKSKEEGNEELNEAAAIISKFLLETDKPQVRKLSSSDPESEEKKKLQKDREDFESQKHTDAQSTLMNRIDNQIKSTIDINIDKNKNMTDFVRKNAVREVQSQLNDALKNDKSFNRVIDAFWKRARTEKYPTAVLDKIKNAHLSQAKTLLQRIIPKVRSEALKGSARREAKPVYAGNRESITPRNSGEKQNNNGQPKKRMSTLDILNS